MVLCVSRGGKRQILLETKGETEEGYLVELIFKLDLGGLILKRKNILEPEKCPNNRGQPLVN
jgi:hypothetical protein